MWETLVGSNLGLDTDILNKNLLWYFSVQTYLRLSHDSFLSHPSSSFNKGRGTSNTTSLLVLIKRHVSAYSEAIIRLINGEVRQTQLVY